MCNKSNKLKIGCFAGLSHHCVTTMSVQAIGTKLTINTYNFNLTIVTVVILAMYLIQAVPYHPNFYQHMHVTTVCIYVCVYKYM